MGTASRKVRPALAGFAALLLLGCGGNGGAPDTPSQSPTPAAALATKFPLAASRAAVSASGLSSGLNASGSIKGVPVSGTGSFGEASAVATSFEGGPALRQSVLLNAILIDSAAWVAYSYSRGSDTYTDDLHRTLGMTGGGEYDVADAPYAFPASVAVGDAGTLGTMSRYSDGTKSAYLGTIVSTYRILADTTAGAAIFQQTDRSVDVYNNVTRTVETRYRITPAGGFALIGISVTEEASSIGATAG